MTEKEHKILKFVLWCIIFFLAAVCLYGCANYQVVQEVQLNMYHLENPKTKKIQVILTEEKLEIGKFYNPKRIRTIDIEEVK